MRPPVVKGVIKKENKYLVLKRSPKAHAFPNHWDFPGGRLEPGETLKEGMEREILEETGLEATAVSELAVYDIEVKGRTRDFHLWKIENATDNITLSNEHTEYKWLMPAEILKDLHEPYMDEFFRDSSPRLL